MAPTTELLNRKFLDDTIVWIHADEKERENERLALLTHNSPCYGRSSNVPLRPRKLTIAIIVR